MALDNNISYIDRWIYSQIDKQIDYKIAKQAYKQIDVQLDGQIVRQIDIYIDRYLYLDNYMDRYLHRQMVRQIDIYINRYLHYRQIVKQIEILIDMIINFIAIANNMLFKYHEISKYISFFFINQQFENMLSKSLKIIHFLITNQITFLYKNLLVYPRVRVCDLQKQNNHPQ